MEMEAPLGLMGPGGAFASARDPPCVRPLCPFTEEPDGRVADCTRDYLPQFVQESLGSSKVGGIEALSEPIVGFSEDAPRLVGSPLACQ